MKSPLRILAVTVGLFCASAGFTQTPAPATQPGAAVNAPGAHTVKESTPPVLKTPAPAHAASPAMAPAAPGEKTGPATARPEAAHKAAAAGGGKVWASAKSKAYHCEGTKLYGKTKDGVYMTEADAKAKGYHAEHGKTCAQ